jgi:endoglycosylceramidase
VLRVIALVALAPTLPAAAARADAALPPLHAVPVAGGQGRIVDDRGRQVILRGVNVNALAQYWKGTRFRTTFPLERGDPQRMRGFGWNAVRLLVSWSRIEPGPGRYDDRYLARVRRTAARLTRAGLYVFVDFHQDAWGPTLAARAGESCPAGSTPALGWDGAPGWATLVGDDVPRCAPDDVRELSPAVRAAWQAFWADRAGPGGAGIQTRFLAAIAHSIERLGRLPGIAGYDVLNEPNAFGADENAALGALYGRAVRAIRPAEKAARLPRRLILFEPSALWSETGNGPPPPFQHDRDVAYAPHIYGGAFDDGPITAGAFRTAIAEAQGFGGVPVLTGEWGAARTRPDYLRSHLDLQDRFGISGTEWTWRESCGDPHQRAAALEGAVATTTFAVWGMDCADNRALGIGPRIARALMRGYVRAAPGRLRRVRWSAARRQLVASGAHARAGVLLDAFYPGRAKITARGLRDATARAAPGGARVSGVARGGAWRLEVGALAGVG